MSEIKSGSTERLKHTEIISDSQKYNIVVDKEFDAYYAKWYTGSQVHGRCYYELDRAIEYYEKQVAETLKFANRTQKNVKPNTIK